MRHETTAVDLGVDGQEDGDLYRACAVKPAIGLVMQFGTCLRVVHRDGDRARVRLLSDRLDSRSEGVETGRDRQGSVPIQRGRGGHGGDCSGKGGAGEVNSKVCC